MSIVSLKSFRRAAVILALAAPAAIPVAASAHDYKLGPITIEHPWTRATTVMTGAAYMTLKLAPNEADRLIGAASPDAERVEMHTMAIDNGIARMRQVPGIALDPGGAVTLKPGGLHLMMIGLKRPLREGESIRLLLTFEKAGTVSVDAAVEKAGAPRPTPHHH